MSSFIVTPKRITIEAHPDADRLEIAQIDGYQCVVKKGEYQSGEVALYIPEGAVIPEQLQVALGVAGYLVGPEHNLVKAVRLRNVLSQGILYRPTGIELEVGKDYSVELGISKFMPSVPEYLLGAVVACEDLHGYTEIEDVKKYPEALLAGEEVVATEKLHGIQTVCFFNEGRLHLTSKGLAKQGLELIDEVDEEGNSTIAYWQAAHLLEIEEKMGRVAGAKGWTSFTLFGETIGVQDLKYGLKEDAVDFRGFDIRVGNDYLDYEVMLAILSEMGIPAVPEIYRGGYDHSTLVGVARGKETLTGKGLHIREGVVVRPVRERYSYGLGRVVLKFLSPDYLLRKNPDATEFE